MKKKNSLDLYNFMVELTYIHCDKCGEKDQLQCNEDTAATEFFNEGWRATKTNCYCPTCAKKYLKSEA